jgi:hypothetical protein
MIAMIAGHLVLLEAMPTHVIDIMLRSAATCCILAGIAASALRLEPPIILVSVVPLPPHTSHLLAPETNALTRSCRRFTAGMCSHPYWLL